MRDARDTAALRRPRSDVRRRCHPLMEAGGRVDGFGEAATATLSTRPAQAVVAVSNQRWWRLAGLCHGVSGNGYALLCMWRATRHPRWLHRARQFGEFICSEQGSRDWGTPDNPCSLYEVRRLQRPEYLTIIP